MFEQRAHWASIACLRTASHQERACRPMLALRSGVSSALVACLRIVGSVDYSRHAVRYRSRQAPRHPTETHQPLELIEIDAIVLDRTRSRCRRSLQPTMRSSLHSRLALQRPASACIHRAGGSISISVQISAACGAYANCPSRRIECTVFPSVARSAPGVSSAAP